MARYICPSCGKPYNGKRCNNCMFENYAEEYSHGNHTHTGEPLVIRGTERKPIPRKDPFECEKKTRKSGLRPWMLAIILLIAVGLFAWAIVGIVSEVSSKIFGSFAGSQICDFPKEDPQKENPTMPSGGITLYDDGSLRIVADWEETRKYTDGIRVVAENNTKQNLNVSTTTILVNNYVMGHSDLYLPVEAGHTADGYLCLDSTDLEYAGIEDIQQVSASFEAYDSDSYEPFAQTEFIPLCSTDTLTQPPADQGETLFDHDGIRLVFKGYAPSSYAPEEFTEGVYLFYLENGTDTTVNFFTDEVTVNGQETYLSLYCSLPPNTQAVQQMYLYSLDDKELNIQSREDVTEMLASFIFYSADGGTELITDPLSIPVDLDYDK